MARRNDHSREQLKELALIAGEELIDKQGLSALSTRKIANQIGYSVGTLYLIFNNLDDLCWHINARSMAKLDELLSRNIGSEHQQTPSATLKIVADSYLDFAARWPNRWTLMFEHHTNDEISTPQWLNDAIEKLFGYVTEPLKALNPHASEASLTLATRSLWCAIHGIAALNAQGKLFLTDINQEPLVNDLLTRYLSSWQQETFA
ncbi:TetR/AcrR family transcriptional regulator [Celerinatantimonas diazotrophica]|uniref:TetR family transcriptional regulator n=1 Tax=Celerinatantimonas diazotrophica TaxID=412034 RepID=A0A4R1J8D5_9GAMM|nr:WHG domain-containing protein [Celerinatantimonas diazotrophica]TCK46730.1 TetR family transcriptional regulator [Celerinatantimonas diazotrophica]CAG9295432.1 hypothetical protein CEDIAZO_00548 [Celerinatantimonas diazotrophica]